jgi:hypothetical protein
MESAWTAEFGGTLRRNDGILEPCCDLKSSAARRSAITDVVYNRVILFRGDLVVQLQILNREASEAST